MIQRLRRFCLNASCFIAMAPRLAFPACLLALALAPAANAGMQIGHYSAYIDGR
jgi:hypothetical protein